MDVNIIQALLVFVVAFIMGIDQLVSWNHCISQSYCVRLSAQFLETSSLVS